MSDDIQKRIDEAIKAAHDGLMKGRYKDEYEELVSRSMKEIKQSIPRASTDDYNRLLSVVEQASAKNAAQAVLVANIKALGSNAVQIAKLIPGLATLLV